MPIKSKVSKLEAQHALKAAREARKILLRVGEVTCKDYKTNSRYVNIIFETGAIIAELKNYADSN